MKFHKPMQVLTIIPARGGSKGLPRKNVLPLAGKPLIAWNIEAALATESISRLVVSTDDAEIADIARQYGAEVIDRPLELAGSSASSESALVHALDELETKEGYSPDLLVFMQCTSPLTTAEDIDTAVKNLIDNNADSCLTAKDFHYFIWQEEQDGSATGINHDKRFRPRRQDREPQYEENGAVYVMKTAGFKEAKHRFFGKTVISLMPPEHCFEIDEPVDIQICEMLLRERQQKQFAAQLPDLIQALVLDFDGVMTDNRVLVDQKGDESVFCDRSDGWGIGQLKKNGIKITVLSTENNPVVTARCRKLGIECRQGLGTAKIDALRNWCKENTISIEQVVFLGNDMNDAECLESAACAVVPADAHPDVRNLASIVLKNNGGNGAVREICDLIINNSSPPRR